MRSNLQFPADLVTFAKKILNGKLDFCVNCFKRLVKSERRFE